MRSLTCVLILTLGVVSVVQISLAAIGDPCLYDRCPNSEAGAYCIEKVCSCQVEDPVSENKLKCLKAARNVGETCEENIQCSHLLTGWAYCNEEKKCACKSGGTFSSGYCQKTKQLGERCVSSQECAHIPNAHCSSIVGPIDTDVPVCACTKLYVPSANNSVCLPIAPFILAPCELDLQCQSLGDNTTCLNMQCQCKEGNHFNIDADPKKCTYNKGIGEFCARGECYLPKDGDKQNIECHYANATCACQNNVASTPGHDSCNYASNTVIISMVWMLVIALTTTLV